MDTIHDADRRARSSVMEIPLFPDLHARLTRVLGPTAERDMVHQLVYWFSRPGFQDRDWAYLTREQWYEQRGLNRKQVDKARARLRVHPSGIVEEKKGPYKRIHYSVNWVALANLLRLPPRGVPSQAEEDASLRTPPRGVPSSSAPPKGGTHLRPPLNGSPSNTGDYSRDYEQDIPLTEGPDGPQDVEKNGVEAQLVSDYMDRYPHDKEFWELFNNPETDTLQLVYYVKRQRNPEDYIDPEGFYDVPF